MRRVEAERRFCIPRYLISNTYFNALAGQGRDMLLCKPPPALRFPHLDEYTHVSW